MELNLLKILSINSICMIIFHIINSICEIKFVSASAMAYGIGGSSNMNLHSGEYFFYRIYGFVCHLRND